MKCLYHLLKHNSLVGLNISVIKEQTVVYIFCTCSHWNVDNPSNVDFFSSGGTDNSRDNFRGSFGEGLNSKQLTTC